MVKVQKVTELRAFTEHKFKKIIFYFPAPKSFAHAGLDCKKKTRQRISHAFAPSREHGN
jgi:hypothetical protein